MGGVKETRGSTSVLGSLGLESRHIVALSGDTGDDRNLVVDRADKGTNDLDLFFFGEKSALPRMTQHDKSLHPVDRAQPRAEALNRFIVDRAVLVKGSDRGGSQSGHVEPDSASRVSEVRSGTATVSVTVGVSVGNHCDCR